MYINHIAMYVEDLEKAKSFFIKYLNGKSNTLYHNKTTDFKSYFITFDNGARLEIMNKPNIKSENAFVEKSGYIHIAFSVGSIENVDMLTQKLKDDGYEILSNPRRTGDGYYESCIVGIENNLIELTV